MSLLLDALNRARREQRELRDAPPGLDTAPPASREWSLDQLLLILVPVMVLLVIAVALLGWLLWRGESPGRDGGAAAGVVDVPPAVTEPPVVAPRLDPGDLQVQEQVREKSGETEEVGDLPRAGNSLSPAEPGTAPSPADGRVAALYQSPREVDSVNREAPGKPDDPPVRDQVGSQAEADPDLEAVLEQAEEAMGNQKLAEHTSPLLESLSQQRKDAIPTLMYLQHDYRSDGGSQVTINRQQARTGDTVAPGVQVEDILPDSVVLSFRGETFRLRALSSWVNL